MRYAVVIEKPDGNYSAYVPDLPGCIATGPTIDAVETAIREAIRFHIEGLEATVSRSPRRRASRSMWRRSRERRTSLRSVRPTENSAGQEPAAHARIANQDWRVCAC
jgi:predicted RNase H-like HicB family nuclease